MPQVANYRDSQQTPLYDTYSVAGSQSVPARIPFFNSRTRTVDGGEITNMPSAGFLPPPNVFTVFGLMFSPIGCDEADLAKLMKQYTAELSIGGKEYLTAPIDFFPGPGGIQGAAATTATTTTIKQWTNGPGGHHAGFALGPEYSITIESNERFEVNLIGAAGFTSTAAIFLRAYLLGVWQKPVR